MGSKLDKRAVDAAAPREGRYTIWDIPREMTREDGAPIAIWHTVVANLPARLVAEIKRRCTVGR